MSIYKYVLAKVANPSKVSHFGIELLHEFEGLRLKAYPDPGSGGDPWTIGYGTTVWKGRPVTQGMVMTPEEAAKAFEEDLSKFEKAVKKAVKVPLTQSQFDALVSFTYNVGEGNFKSSTLLKKLNEEKYSEAAEQFLRWVYASDRVMQGLVARRKKEKAHFLGELK